MREGKELAAHLSWMRDAVRIGRSIAKRDAQIERCVRAFRERAAKRSGPQRLAGRPA